MELYPDPESNKEEKKAGAENKLFRLRSIAVRNGV